jgi:xylose isomerase
MRSYLILKDKVEKFNADAEIQGLLNDLRVRDEESTTPGATDGYSTARAAALKEHVFDIASLAGRGRRYEELDQLVMDLLLGVR